MAAVGPSPLQAYVAAPNVTNDDLMAFFDTHFSDAAIQAFKSDFFNPNQQFGAADAGPSFEDVDILEEEEEDDLGYYPDGVKRTLTDEQIAMFRHSELEALKREQGRAAERRSTGPQPGQAGETGDDGSLKTAESSHQQGRATKNKKKRKGGKAKNQEPKPDLRKRTWDVVEAGLDTLDYD
ncbi:hypothetical protein CH063_07989 [Colletotrichum higginsianum]|uniref:Uncharacterized protein n=2 Tax=Colletotrichum higginsianum TaxID=80884 RepID=H1V855_COLHI|nr:hypothetical protein CH63R_05950 [Colletotrichum higginsianum IMI 349063]OBR10258.1 hypothetical protein CH63R_05950 [Colletotrichum higginsianum IMI 349063]TID07427.1 Uncharacterized protein CH35J_001204 [Colletotrichum higginsianum]CCF36407.1 hypothetical protein CH063_07989 [Colletotrichum higginsianum]